MQDQSNTPDTLEQSVQRMTSEIAALKLELATLHSALIELQHQSGSRRRPAAAVEPPVRPSVIPAAVVVLLASGLLSWQVITNPRVAHPAVVAGSAAPAAAPVTTARAAVEAPAPLPAAPAPPPVYRGTLTVRADHPGATVFVNRKNVGTAPVRVRNLRAGSHLVWVESNGYRRWSRVVTVPAEKVTRVTADLEPITENH